MKHTDLKKTLDEVKNEIVQQLDKCDLPHCAFVWFGDDVPKTCESGLSVAITGTIQNSFEDNFLHHYFDFEVIVSICPKDPETADESTEFSAESYNTLNAVYIALIVWWEKKRKECSMAIAPDGFTPMGREDGCQSYSSQWRIEA